MATFSAKKLDLTQVNGGQEYEQGDFLQSDTINDVVEGTAYAQNVAEAANTTSNKAVSTANSANNTANAASTKVDGFDERITAAKNKADTAYDNAATAQGTADSATTEINKIKNGTTTVPNAQHAVSADSADLATKATQDVNGNSIVDTYATKNEVAEKQGTKVYYGSALQPSVTFDSNPQTQITANKSNINDIVSGAQTVGKAKADQKGNVIDTTYAKLTQVVRTDAAQSLTAEEKTRAKDNVVIRTEKAASASISKGWYRVAKLNRQTAYSVTIGQSYNYNEPSNIKLVLNLGYSEAVITQESGINPSSWLIDRVRVCVGTNIDAFFDVYLPNTIFNATKINIDRLYSNTDVVAIETYENWEYIGTSDTVTGYNVTLLDIVSGTNTSGQVYQQGEPVLTYLGNISPNDAPIPNKINSFYIPNGAEGSPSSGAGWAISGGSNGSYGAQLAGFDDDKLYYRTMRGNGWESWQSVFKTDPSKLEPSTANGWTVISKTGSLPSAGVYLITTTPVSAIGIMVAKDGSGRCLLPGAGNDYEHLKYNELSDDKWKRYAPSGQEIVTNTIYYKRIA